MLSVLSKYDSEKPQDFLPKWSRWIKYINNVTKKTV